MLGYSFFKIYTPIKLHFTSSYDIFKYKGKSKVTSEDSFLLRKDKVRFDYFGGKINNSKVAGQFCLANFLTNDVNWIYQSFTQAEECYLKWKAQIDSFNHLLSEDLNQINEITKAKSIRPSSVFSQTPKGNKPPLMQMFLSGHCSKETLLVIDSVVHPFLDNWSECYSGDPLVTDTIFKLKKYRTFITLNISNATEVIKKASWLNQLSS